MLEPHPFQCDRFRQIQDDRAAPSLNLKTQASITCWNYSSGTIPLGQHFSGGMVVIDSNSLSLTLLTLKLIRDNGNVLYNRINARSYEEYPSDIQDAPTRFILFMFGNN